MKKRTVLGSLVAMIAVLALSFSLLGCTQSDSTDTGTTGSNSNSTGNSTTNTNTTDNTTVDKPAASRYAGTYYLQSLNTQGVTISGTELDQSMSNYGGLNGQYVEVIDSENCAMQLSGKSLDVRVTTSGNTLTWEDTTTPAKYIIDGDTLTFVVGEIEAGESGQGYTMVFAKSGTSAA